MNTFEGYAQADYSSENWMILLNAKAEGDLNIDNATSVEDVMLALVNAQAAMAAVKTLLDDAKEEAHASLNAALAGYAQDDYSPENWIILLNITDDTDNADSVADVMTALNSAQAAMAAINTLLTDAKIAAHTDLNAALAVYSRADYSHDNWTVLKGFKEAGSTAIDAAADLVEVEAAQSAAITGMEGVQTIAQTLAAAKSAALEALAEVFGDFTESDYTADDWAVLKGFKETGNTAIEAAADLVEVEVAQSAAVTGMEGVQTIARTLAAAKSAAHETLAAAFETDKESNDIFGDDTESNDIVDEDTQSDDTVDDGAELTDFVTGDTETDDVVEIEQMEEPPAAGAPDYATGIEAVDSDVANDAEAASQEISETNNDAPNAAEEKSADLGPALESMTLDTTN